MMNFGKLRMLITMALALCAALLSACEAAEQVQSGGIETAASSEATSSVQTNADSEPQRSSQPNRGNQEQESEYWEQTVFVHEGLPTFALQLRGEDDDDYSELSIVDSATEETVYREEYATDSDNYGINKERFETEIMDMDFDGYQDIRLFIGYGGNWRKDYRYIMWDPNTSSFTGDAYGLGNLGNPTFDTEEKLVHSMDRASAADHWFYTHQYVDGELVMIEEVSDNCVWDLLDDEVTMERIAAVEPLFDKDSTTFTQFVKRRLNLVTMEMEIVEHKYVLYDSLSSDMLAEYTPDSEIGVLLSQYVPRDDWTADERSETPAYIEAYEEFMRGERLASPGKTSWEPINIYEVDTFFRSDIPESYSLDGSKYALFDMNGDSLPELHVRSELYYCIFTYHEEDLAVWYNARDWSWPTDDCAILYTRLGGGPPRWEYKYEVLDFWGNVTLAIEFEKDDLNADGIYNGDDTYIFEDVRVTMEQWDALTEEYLSATSDTIEWFDLTNDFSHIQ